MEPVPIVRLALLALIGLIASTLSKLAQARALDTGPTGLFERTGLVVGDTRPASVGHGRPPAGLTVADSSSEVR